MAIVGGGQIRDYSFSRAWGVNPSSASGTIVVEDGGFPGLVVDQPCNLSFGSLVGFSGILSELVSSVEFGSNLLTFQIVDNRVHLGWQTVYGAWNIEDDLGMTDTDSGIRRRRYRHLLPENWAEGLWTYTDAPMKTNKILDSAFDGAEGSFSFSRSYHSALNAGILVGLDYSTGIKLANLISEINGKTGLEVGLSGTNGLVWCRKGDGIVPLPPLKESAPYSKGLSISSTDTAIRVVGERKRVQRANIALVPDWREGWGDYIEETAWRRAVSAATGKYSSDTKEDQLLLSAYARTITVAKFAEAKGDSSLLDPRRFGKVSRNQLPAWVYIRELVYKSYRIPSSFTADGLPLRSLDFADGLICAMDVSGTEQIQAKPVQYYPSCQAAAIVIGQPLDLINAQDIREFYKNSTGDLRDVWTAAPDFEVDSFGKSIRFNTPIFVDGVDGDSIYLLYNQGEGGGEDLTSKVDANSDYLKIAVPNPDYVITPAQVKASFCFLTARYYHDYGSGKRHGSIASSGLDQHLLDNGDGKQTEVPYEDGQNALQKAHDIAASALALDSVQTSGGYTRHGGVGTALSPCVDRVTVNINTDGGVTEQVEYAKARSSGAAFSERTLQRIQRSEETFSGQESLKREVRQYRLMAAAESSSKSSKRSKSHHHLADVFQHPVGSKGISVVEVRNVNYPSGGWRAGDIVWLDSAGDPVSSGNRKGVFGGVVVMSVPSKSKTISLAYSGRVPVRVNSGIEVHGVVMGDSGASVGSSSGQVAVGRLAHAEITPKTTSGKVMAMVDIGVGGVTSRGLVPWQPKLITEGTGPSVTYYASFNLGTVNGVAADNWNDKFLVPNPDQDPQFLILNISAGNGKIQGVAIALESSAPTEDSISKNTPPPNFKIVLGAINGAGAQMIVFNNISMIASEIFRESLPTPATGGEPFSRWWRWTSIGPS